ncbi:penicillin-binding transpeptidase domain-containing protein [Jatrophihabitans sp. YIM 134969]
MSGVSHRRVAVIGGVIVCLVLTLIGRLTWVQLLDPNKPQQNALDRTAAIVVPAPRGLVVDARGRTLVGNQATHVITVDRQQVLAQPDRGKAVLQRLGDLLGMDPRNLAQQITPCSPTVPSPCWIGEPYQPVPVSTGAPDAAVLTVAEHRELYPGVAVSTQTVRTYPHGALAAHLLGYTGAVDGDDKKADSALVDSDTIGRAGLEASYDSVLRGVDGATNVVLDPAGNVISDAAETPAKPGDTLVTSLDLDVQALAEKAIADQVAAQRQKGRPATSAAVVVMDPNTGRVIAAASYPSYDPTVFVGGISVADYAKLTDPAANDPLVGRAISGQYAPGSTFKLISSSDDVMSGQYKLGDTYTCPPSLQIDGRTKTNFDSESLPGPIDLAKALQYSCDTWFYRFAADEYYADQAKVDGGGKASESMQRMAAAYGVGSDPGLDLPADEQASGSYADRETRQQRWDANKAQYCADAKTGYPDEPDPAQRQYLTQLASENCTDGWRYRAGDNADMAIGQGETTMSPLQLALAYSAMVNGGTLWKPTLGWQVVDSSGKVVRTISPTKKATVPVDRGVLDYIANALQFQKSYSVSGAGAFITAPYTLGGKTGTAEVEGKNDTSWLASWGPVTQQDGHPHARFVVVGMMAETGTGASASAPMLREVYDGLLGNGQPAALPNGTPTTKPVSVPAAGATGGLRPAGSGTPLVPNPADPGTSDVLPPRAPVTKPAGSGR